MVHSGKGQGWASPASSDKPQWKDLIPKKKKKRSLSTTGVARTLFDLPGELLDLILSDVVLNLRDHLALAASCRSFRSAYYSPSSKNSSSTQRHSSLWSGLIKLRPAPQSATQICTTASEAELSAIQHIWTNKAIEKDEMKVIRSPTLIDEGKKGKKRKRKTEEDEQDEDDLAIRSKEWNQAIVEAHHWRITKTDAKKLYKLSDNDLNGYLYAYCKPNPHARRSGAPMHLFLEIAVESLALRLHGGVIAHENLLKKRAASAQKAAETRKKNGTTTGGNRGGGRKYGYYDYGCCY